MNRIGKLVGVVLLASLLEVTTLACPDPPPGIIETPPCAPTQQVVDDQTALGQLETPPALKTADLTSALEETLITFLLF
jgi:hypothetical protein